MYILFSLPAPISNSQRIQAFLMHYYISHIKLEWGPPSPQLHVHVHACIFQEPLKSDYPSILKTSTCTCMYIPRTQVRISLYPEDPPAPSYMYMHACIFQEPKSEYPSTLNSPQPPATCFQEPLKSEYPEDPPPPATCTCMYIPRTQVRISLYPEDPPAPSYMYMHACIFQEPKSEYPSTLNSPQPPATCFQEPLKSEYPEDPPPSYMYMHVYFKNP